MQKNLSGNNSPRKKNTDDGRRSKSQSDSTPSSRKTARQLLKEHEERLRMATEATQLGTWDYQPQTNQLYWSDACRRIYDVPTDVPIDYQFFTDHIHPDDREFAQLAIATAMDPAAGTYDIQFRILRYSDKKVRWIRSQGKVFFDALNQPELFIGTVLDISAQNQKEQELADSIALFKRMADNVPVIIWMTAADGHFSYLNEQWEEFTGQTHADTKDNGWMQAVHPDDRQSIQRTLMSALRDTNPFSFTFRVRDKNGSYQWFMSSGKPNFSPEGERDGFIGCIINVNEQKIAEENSAWFAAIVQTSNDAIISKTLDGIITSWNPAAERLFGYKAIEIVGQPIYKLIPVDRREEEPAIIARLAKGEIVDHFDTKRVTKAGNEVDISLTISPITDKRGNITGASKIVRDVTAQRRQEHALQESEQKFRNLVMQAPAGIAILIGEDYIVEVANQAYLELVDKKEESFVGRNLFDAIPEVKPAVEPVLKNVLTSGEPYFGEEFAVNLNRGGKIEVAYFNFVYQPLKNNDEKTIGIIVIANEVTKQVETKHQLSESEREFRRMVTQSPIAMTIWRGPEYVIEIANRQMIQHIWRKKEEEVIGKKALEVFPELMAQKYPALLEKVLAGRKPHREAEAMTWIDGADGMRKFYLDFEYAPLFERDGTVSGIMITVYDVTEKVEARHQVEFAEERLRMAAEGTGLATWDLNLVSREIIYSPRLNEIFGHSPEAKLLHAEMRDQIHPDDKQNIVEKAFEAALKTGIYDYEARVIRPDNRPCWIRTQGRVIFGELNRPLRMLGTMRDITEQKEIQRALIESESRMNIAIEAAELGTWELDLLTNKADYSKRYLQLLGFEENARPTHAELISRIYPEDIPRREEAMKVAMLKGTLDIEMRIMSGTDNSTRWIKARGKVFYDDNGVPSRMLGTVMDVTRQRNFLQNLQESEERFKTIANTAPVMIWMSGNDKFSDFFNTSWLNFTGRSMEEEVGDGWLQNVHPEDVLSCIAVYNKSYASKEEFHLEYRLKRYDGHYRWIADNAVPRIDPSGNFIGFISACMDIDDEKTINQRLQASELLFKTITNVSPVGLWMTNVSGENTFVNDTWTQWTGTGAKGEGSWVDSLVDEDKDTLLNLFRERAASREKFTAEFRFKLSSGETRWGLSEGFPYYDTEGKFSGYAGSVTDITERKQEELKKNDFLAVASHELKTPITSIKAYTQLLAKTYEKTDDVFLKNALGKVENQVGKMSKLVGDFLNLSKIESDRFQLEREEFFINDLVKEIVSDTQLVTLTHEIRIEEADRFTVNADREKIAQVLTNLLTNAVKYSPDAKQVEVAIATDGDMIEVAILDKGIGIREEEREKIFERFYRAGPNNIQFSGFGIGLYISAEIIHKHEGQIGVTAYGDKGSRFYFKLKKAK